MPATNAVRREDDSALEIDLHGEAKDTAIWVANRFEVTPGDVVARALGLLYFLILQQDSERLIVSEDRSGRDRRPIMINLRAGDAGSKLHSSG